MKRLIENFRAFLDEQEKPPTKQQKNNIFDYPPDLKQHQKIMFSLARQGALNYSTAKINPEKRKKHGVNIRCGYWGPLIDLTATAEKAKKSGFFSQKTSTDIGKLYVKLKRFNYEKEQKLIPSGFVMIDRDAFSVHAKYDPQAFASNFGAGGAHSLEDVAKDAAGKTVVGTPIKPCPKGHKCFRKCYKSRKVPVDKITMDMMDFTSEPIFTKNQVGVVTSIKYAPGTKYATLDFEEAFDPEKKKHANAFKKAAENTRKIFNKIVFVGIYAPEGKVKKTSPYQRLTTSVQIFIADGWDAGAPTGNVYPAVINQRKRIDIFLPIKEEKFTW
jgi:hypothetical protein